MVQTVTGGTNTVFATTGLLGDSNLLQHAIQNAVFGTTPSLSLDITRFAGVVASRTDMDQSQFPSDVSPGAGQQGIYDQLIPILQQWKQQYNFVGSFYINIGDDANPANENSTNWAVSAPYYDAIMAMGSEIGNHSPQLGDGVMLLTIGRACVPRSITMPNNARAVHSPTAHRRYTGRWACFSSANRFSTKRRSISESLLCSNFP